MSKLTFEEAKQLVADRHGHENWQELRSWKYLPNDPVLGMEEYYKEVAELLANEAVKEDRNKIIEANPSDIVQNGLGHTMSKINMIKLAKISLPYPVTEK